MNQYRMSENKERYRSLPKSREHKDFHLKKLLGLLTTDVQELVTSVWEDLDNDKDSEEQKVQIINLKKENKALQNQIGQLKQKVSVVLHNEETKRYLKDKISELEKLVDNERQARLKVEKSYQAKLDMLQHTIDQQENKIEFLEKEKRKSKDDLVNREEQRANKSLSERCDHLEKKLLKSEEELKKTQNELEYTKTRTRKPMGYRLTDKNPNIADLSDRNRPTKLGERFQEIYDNEWTDAFETIGSGRDEDEKILSVLVSILMDTKTFCDKEAENQMKKIQSALIDEPNSNYLKFFHGSTALPANVNEQLKEIRKDVAELIGEHIYKRYQKDLRYSMSSTARKAASVPKYLEACFNVCWLMSIQDPPVVFGPDIQRGDEFKTDLYKTYTKSGKKVAYVVWPTLLLHTKGPVLCKGVAQGLEDTTHRSKSTLPSERGDRGTEFLGGYKSVDLRNDTDHMNERPMRENATKPLEHESYTIDDPYETKHIHSATRSYDSTTPSYESNYRSGTAFRTPYYLQHDPEYSDHGYRSGADRETVVSRPSHPSQKNILRREAKPVWKE